MYLWIQAPSVQMVQRGLSTFGLSCFFFLCYIYRFKVALIVLKIAHLTTVWHEIFTGSNFGDFGDFSSDPQKKKFLQIKITAGRFPAKIYSRLRNRVR